MSLILFLILTICITHTFAQVKDTTVVFKKRVLESTEVDFVSSYYSQDGEHAAVSGGLGTEKLNDFASNIIVAIPLNDDETLTFDVGISAYTSASSSNVNPFNSTFGASGASGQETEVNNKNPTGTPWQASSGASKQGDLYSLNTSYSHSSDNRNLVWTADIALSNEFNYSSKGIGAGITKLFNNKNSEISFKSNVYLDNWKIIYPTELNEYYTYGSAFLSKGHFSGVTVLDQNGVATNQYKPISFVGWDSTVRNSFAASVSYSQIATKNMQFSLFFDILQQQGMLSTPYQRVYFADKANYYIGDKSYIPVYSSTANQGVYQLADDIERMPHKRTKLPIGLRWNYYVNEKVAVRTYFRYYTDSWNVQSKTASIELPVKITDAFTIYPMYRFYTQTQASYFAPYEQHLSTEEFYTSDYDLAAFNANQYGFGFNYTDIFARFGIFGLGLKNIDFRFNHYSLTDGLQANIGSIGFKFVTD